MDAQPSAPPATMICPNAEAHFKTNHSRLIRAAVRFGADWEDAEDRAQEAFAAACAGERSLQAREALPTWVNNILKNKVADSIRKQKRQNRPVPLDLDAEADGDGAVAVFRPLDGGLASPSMEEEVISVIASVADARLLHAALTQLKTEQREVLDLLFFANMQEQAIADHLQIPLGTVKSRRLQARRHLAAILLRMGYTPNA